MSEVRVKSIENTDREGYRHLCHGLLTLKWRSSGCHRWHGPWLERWPCGVGEAVSMSHDSRGTTETGYVNPNGQVVIRDTGAPGTDKFQRIYQMACSKCGHNYGANGSDCHLRLCPKCQGGAEGLPLGRGADA